MNKKNLYRSVALTTFIPFVGMLYIGHGIKGLIYFFLSIFGLFISLATIHYEFFKDNSIAEVVLLFQCIINLIASLHCYFLLKANDFRNRTRWYSKWYMILLIVFIILLLVAFINQFIIPKYTIKGDSMRPNLYDGQVVISIHPTTYSFIWLLNNTLFNSNRIKMSPKKGDIVIYCADGNCTYDWYGVARVIAASGDYFGVISNKLHLNSNKYLIEHDKELKIVPQDHCLIQFDSPPIGYYGDLIHNKQIVGYAKYIIWDKQTRKFVGKLLT